MDSIVSTADRLARRARLFGPNLHTICEDPSRRVCGLGTRVWHAGGHAYLHCNHNVPLVGHCHPRVATRSVVLPRWPCWACSATKACRTTPESPHLSQGRTGQAGGTPRSHRRHLWLWPVLRGQDGHDRTLKTPAPRLTTRIANEMRQRGIRMNKLGLHDTTLKIRPPPPLSLRDADQMLHRPDAIPTELGQTDD